MKDTPLGINVLLAYCSTGWKPNWGTTVTFSALAVNHQFSHFFQPIHALPLSIVLGSILAATGNDKSMLITLKTFPYLVLYFPAFLKKEKKIKF